MTWVSRLTISATIITGAAAASAAACPVPADMERAGIVIGFADGSEVVYAALQTQPGRMIEANRTPEPNDGYWVESWLGVYPLADGLLRNGRPDRRYFSVSNYEDPLERLPAPAPGASWRGAVTETDSRGATLGETFLTVTFEGRRRLQIGQCAYAAIQVETLYADAEGGFQATLDYLPDLGVAVQTAGGELGALLDFYHPVSIRAARPDEAIAEVE
ncbi:MAG: hypothetical protein AAFN79_02885 [Pseudomonadota bacterium]